MVADPELDVPVAGEVRLDAEQLGVPGAGGVEVVREEGDVGQATEGALSVVVMTPLSSAKCSPSEHFVCDSSDMRADRLVATLLLMQARGRVTAAEVAAELEVSVATARRDLEALSTAGIPVYPQPGRGGGWSLVGGARTDLTGLTSSEAQALFLLVGLVVRPVRRRDLRPAQAGPRAAGDVPRGGRGRRSRGGRGPGRVGVRRAVPTAVGRGAAGCGRPAAAGDARLRRAVRAESERTVDPWALVDKGDHLVPRRRHARGAPDVPAGPGRRADGAGHRRAPARRPRRRGDLGVGGRRGRAAPRARDGDRR